MLSEQYKNNAIPEVESDDSTGEKSCRLCRKLLSNDHFLNPKTGSLFAVCDICRKRKRDKYWKNKEIMRQSLLDASYLSKPKYTSYRRNRSVSISDKSEETSGSSIFTSPEAQYTDPHSLTTPVSTSFMNNTSVPSLSSLPRKGSLIIIPPQFTHFIRSNIHNPAYIKRIIGEHYWKELCLSDISNLFESFFFQMHDFSSETLGIIKKEFLEYQDIIEKKIGKILVDNFHIPEVLRENIIEMVRYNAVGGKMIRGLFSVYSTYALSNNWDTSMKEQAFLVGWCAELLQAAFLIADDIMDNAQTRRGKTAWFRIKSVGMSSINDTFILLSMINRLVFDNLPNKQTAASIIRLFEDIKLRTEMGQLLDLSTINQESSTLNFQYFNTDYYMEIISNKTAYYTIFLPVYVGLLLTQKKEIFYSQRIQEVCMTLGTFFQIRDDYLDVFADPSVLGKKGTDIQEGKCSWVVLQVLEQCTQEEKDVLQAHYGVDNEEDVRIVRQVFSKYDVASRFVENEKQAMSRVKDILMMDEFPAKDLIPLFQLLNSKLFGMRV